MNLNTLLKENSKLSLKDTMRFLFVLQDFLLEQYPNFKTKIIPNTDKDDLPLAIEWKVGDFTIIIIVSIKSLYSINNNEIRIWFTIPMHYCQVTFDKNILFADEISFDIPAILNKIFDSDKTSLSPAKILAGVNDGSIESIRPYLLYQVNLLYQVKDK